MTRLFSRTTVASVALLLGSVIGASQREAAGVPPAGTQPARAERDLERGLAQIVRPFLETYCINRHGGPTQKPISI